jgi:hypothetical protein
MFKLVVVKEAYMARSREVIKGLIKLAETFEEADSVLKDEYPSINERLAYLKGMFSVNIAARSDDNIECDYKAVLTAIINQKWRA